MPSEKDLGATSLLDRMNPPGGRAALKDYGLALVLSGLALLFRGVLPIKDGIAIYFLPVAAVVLSAWYGGSGPGLFAALASAMGVLYWLVPPVHSFKISPDHALSFFLFILVCLLLGEFSAGRRRIGHAFREGEERFRVFLDVAADAIMIHADDGTVVEVNRQACESLGYTRQELIGMKPAGFAGLDERGLRRVLDQVESRDSLTLETTWRRKDGTFFPVHGAGVGRA